MADFPDYAQLSNLAIIEDQYLRYQKDPASVDPSWQRFFEGIDFARFAVKEEVPSGQNSSILRIVLLIQSYRRYGHLLASINPLEAPPAHISQIEDLSAEELKTVFPAFGLFGKKEATGQEILSMLQEIYASRIGFEYMDFEREIEEWFQEQIEKRPNILEITAEEKLLLLEELNQSEALEAFLHTRYGGQTRFSLEGNETLIPMLLKLIDRGAEIGIEEFWIGMSHRGRLNVVANVLKQPYSSLFNSFENDTALSFFGNDDVKYHMGFFTEIETNGKRKVAVGLPSNPSHLESVDPVLLGQVRGRQQIKKDFARDKTLPLLIHGDAAVAGQGVVYESLQLMRLEGYRVGGAIHIVLNNQIGYTTLPQEGRSTRYCTDIAKAFGIPVVHVNAEDPESCLFAAKLAVEFRQKFKTDLFIDLIGYRKYGHNEGDEPSFTQPVEYQKIRSKPSIRQMYLDKLLSDGHLEKSAIDALETAFKETLRQALAEAQKIDNQEPPLKKIEYLAIAPVDEKTLRMIVEKFCQVPQHFHLHPKLQKWLETRKKMDPIDWATAECLAFGSLLLEGVPIRLAGQDSERGTFSQRHMIWSDTETGAPYSPLASISAGFEVVNSPLTEFAGMGFEYGYSSANPKGLVLWEAQYGDFDNGAQIIIDQYIASAEQKWNINCPLVLLLPHAYEGAGPEHSSARLERFLQLSAKDNMQITYPSTPAQYFHLLRRQMKQGVAKPLIVFTPKSLLRASACTSALSQLAQGAFAAVLDDPTPPPSAKRLLLCSGKVFYDLLAERAKRPSSHHRIVRIEQLYPTPLEEIKKVIGNFEECIWVQEEPENMGAWNFIRPILEGLGKTVRYVGRPSNATPATGSHKKHQIEQATLIEQAFK